MALDKASGGPAGGPGGLNNIGGGAPSSVSEALRNKASLGLDTIEFKKALKDLELQRSTGQNQASPAQKLASQTANSADKLNLSAGVSGNLSPGAAQNLKFSNHAVERMRSRGINFPPEEMRNIENAVAKAAAKGSKDTLVLSGDNALIVSVKNNTIVTVMDKAGMKENVFTNIDSTVVI